MRLIDAEWLASKLRKTVACMDKQKGLSIARHYWAKAIKWVLEKLDEVPTVDAEPVVHAHWEEIRNACGELEGWMCSNPKCGTEVVCASDYCPHCGAKMDEEAPHD